MIKTYSPPLKKYASSLLAGLGTTASMCANFAALREDQLSSVFLGPLMMQSFVVPKEKGIKFN